MTAIVTTNSNAARTALSNAAGLNSLASVTYVSLGTITTAGAVDVQVELQVTAPATPSGNKQGLLFCRTSLDGTHFTGGPNSGTTTSDQQSLYPLDAINGAVGSNPETRIVSVLQALGCVPPFLEIVYFNDNAALAASGHGAWQSLVTISSQ